MSLHTWWLFVATTFLVSSTPGPNMLHILTRSVRFGFRRSMATMAGCAVASGIAMALSATGLGAVLLASPGLFEAIRILGIGYLIYLGVMTWRGAPQTTSLDPQGRPGGSRWALFRGGFSVSAGNPKLLLYSSSVIPQFIDPAAAHAPQLAILVATFVVGDVFWYACYAYWGERLSRSLSKPAVSRAFDRVAGGVFVLFGFGLLVDERG